MFNFIKSKISDFATRSFRSISGEMFARGFSMFDIESRFGEKVVEPFKQVDFVNACIREIAEDISMVPLKIYSLDKDNQEIPIDSNDKLYKLFDNPNPYMGKQSFIEGTSTFTNMRGECVIIAERPRIDAIPLNFYPVDAKLLKPIIDKRTNHIIKWKYTFTTPDGAQQEYYYEPFDIIQTKLFNPFDFFRGLNPLIAYMMKANTLYNADIYNEKFFSNGANVSGFLLAKEVMGETQLKQLEAHMNKYKGSRKAFQTMFINGNVDYKQAKVTHEEMQFLKTNFQNGKSICMAYGMNIAKLGWSDEVKSFGSHKEINKEHWEDCIQPHGNRLVNAFNNQFMRYIYNGKYRVKFDYSGIDALKEAEKEKAETAKLYFSMAVPFNDINKKLNLGFESIEGGDVGYLPINLIPSTEIGGEEEETTTDEESKEKNYFNVSKFKEIEDKFVNKFSEHVVKAAKTKIEKQKEIYIKLQRPIEKQFLGKLKKYFIEQRSRVIKRFNAEFNKDLTSDVFQIKSETDKLKKVLAPLFELGLETGAQSIAELLGNADFEFKPIGVFADFINLKIKTIPKIVLTTIENELRRTIKEGIEAGEGINELTDRIKATYSTIDRSGALRIARTESASAISKGRYEEMKIEGVKKHTWLTAADENVRDGQKGTFDHASLEGMTIEIGKSFNDDNLKFPGDPDASPGDIINCRCHTIPVLED